MDRSISSTDISPWPAILLLSAGQLMMILDGSIVTVALATIQDSLGFSPQGLAWVINAYLIAFGGLLLLAGRLGDLYGSKRVFLAGLAVFTVASLLCGAATSPGMLVAARFLQGIGGAATSAVTLGMIVRLSRTAQETTKAIGVYSFAQAAGGSIGLLAGGILAQTLGWQWIFWVNLPVGIVLALLAWKRLTPDVRIEAGKAADVPGAVLITAALMLSVYAIVQTTDHGWVSVHTLGAAIVAIVLLGGFVWRQATTANPLVPLRIFQSRLTAWGNLVMALMVAGMFGFQFLGALYLQNVLGLDASDTGLAIWPVALVIGIFSLFLTARLVERFGARRVLLSGLALIVAGLGVFTRAPVDGHYVVDVLPVMLLLGVGFGMAMPALATIAMSSVVPADSGLASGLFNTAQQVGGALGLAVLAILANARTGALLAKGDEAVPALGGGYSLAFGVAAAIVAVAAMLAATTLRTGVASEQRAAASASQG